MVSGATRIATTQSTTKKSYSASGRDQAAILVVKPGSLSASNATITKSGDTSSTDNSSFYGQNAAVLAASGAGVALTDSTITATGTGANGLYSYGTESVACMIGGSITATAKAGHALMAAGGGTVIAQDVDLATAGANGGAIASDRGSGTVIVQGGTVTTGGADSPVIYSTGAFTVAGITGTAKVSEGVVVEGANSVKLSSSQITAASEGVMLYQSNSGDASTGRSSFTMSGGSLSTTGSTRGHFSGRSGDAFYVAQTTGTIALSGGASIRSANGVLLYVAKKGVAVLTASGEKLTGNVVLASGGGSAAVKLTNGSTLTGTVSGAGLTLDASSSWTVTANSTLAGVSGLQLDSGTVTNIVGNGHTVTYDASAGANATLGGRTYQLTGGGTLTPR